jgi:ectoine hydroxylase
MTPEDILSHPARVLSSAQREAYFADGFLATGPVIPQAWMDRLCETSERLLEESRRVTASNEAYDIGPEHSAGKPHVRRLRKLVDRDPVFWDFASAEDSPLPDIAADLVGPNVMFHSAKLNYKWPGGGEVVKWHQDITAWPHTNYSLVTLGINLGEVTPEHGPLICIPGSHDGPLYFHTDSAGTWTGAVADDDLRDVDLSAGVEALGGPGSLVAINCRTLHGSRANSSPEVRPLALYVYGSADAFAWMPAPSPTSRTGDLVRGAPPRFAHVDPRPCPVPPNWEEFGYGSIYTAQAEKM